VRWLTLALSAVCLSTGAVVLVSLFVASESALSEQRGESATAAQYDSEDGGHVRRPPRGATRVGQEVDDANNDLYTAYARWLEQANNAHEASGAGGSAPVSQGSIPGARRPPPEEISIMEPPTPYSQVVDNASPGSFSERGWKESTGGKAQYYGEDYSYVEASRVGYPARFRVEIPATGHYTVYARWPAAGENNRATRFGVSTTSGIEWTRVDQREDGGIWVRLGAYEMEAGNGYAVQVSGYRAKGRVVADSVMVVRGTQVTPPVTDSGSQARGGPVVQRARDHIGTPYVHSPPGTCEAHRSVDCSCLTSLVYGEWQEMPDHPVEQWAYGREVERSDLRPGDLVFFKEAGAGYPITHVGIYSGRGNMIHASSYWGSVVESPIDQVSGYYGARRLERS
jgi:cell wall-associated NlpC family hydrolase